jgi:cleavage and polyadenylation specificity factor subunit 3
MIPGYCVEGKTGKYQCILIRAGTLAKTILSEPEEVETMEGRMVPLQMSVHYISFSAHSDFEGTSTFIDSLSPPNIVRALVALINFKQILVHGEKNEMSRLQQTLLNRYSEKKIEVHQNVLFFIV